MPSDQQKIVMERDRRLTGNVYGQRDEAKAPEGFELSSAWRVGSHTYITPYKF